MKIPRHQSSTTEMPTALSESSIADCWKINGISRVCSGRRPPEHSISALGSKVMIQMLQHLPGNCNVMHSCPLLGMPLGCSSNISDLAQRRHPRTKYLQNRDLFICLTLEKNITLQFASECELNAKMYCEKVEVDFNSTVSSSCYTHTPTPVCGIMFNCLIKERQHLNYDIKSLQSREATSFIRADLILLNFMQYYRFFYKTDTMIIEMTILHKKESTDTFNFYPSSNHCHSSLSFTCSYPPFSSSF